MTNSSSVLAFWRRVGVERPWPVLGAGVGASRDKVRDGQANSGSHDRRQEGDHRRGPDRDRQHRQVRARGVPERRRINSSEELGGGMEVGRRRFGQGCEASLVPGRVQTQGRARRRGLAAYRLGRGCDSPKQTRPLPPRLVTATTGKTGSGRIVNREALRLAIAMLLVRRDQHEKSRVRSVPRGRSVPSMTACRRVIVDGMVGR